MAISETTKGVVSGIVSNRKQVIVGLETDIATRTAQNEADQAKVNILYREISSLETDIPKPTISVMEK